VAASAENGRPAHATAEAVARQSYGKLIAFLAARTRDVAAAEDALSDAFAAALAEWPAHGIPHKPEAWLLAVARRKAIDGARRRRTSETAASELRMMAEEIEDRVASASAFLVAPAAMGQRLVRAKQKIAQAGIPFRLPDRADLAERLDAVLDAIYATFAEGWTDPVGTEARRRNLAEEGIWLGRLVASLLPEEPEALGLLALMLYAEARRAARRDANGDFVPLGEQDTARWDGALIDEAEALLRAASANGSLGRYQLEAAIQSAHVVRRLTRVSAWDAIAQLYDALLALTGSPVVAINRAVAIAETQGPVAGLAALDALGEDRRLAEYQPYWAARADLLVRTGAMAEADRAYELAIGLESDPAVRRFLEQRRDAIKPR